MKKNGKKSKKYLPVAAAVALILAFILIIMFSDGKITGAAVADEKEDKKTLYITGLASIDALPDQVMLSIGVKTLSLQAAQSQKENADIMAKVLDALGKSGIPKTDMSTTQYSMTELREWDKTYAKQIFKGYQTINIISVKVKDMGIAGKALDAASQAGANQIGSVGFTLSKQKKEQVKMDVLKLAAQNAQEKAELLTNTLGAKLGEPIQITQTEVSYTPYYRSNLYAEAAGSEAAPTAPSTELLPGEVAVSANVQVTYSLN